MYYSIQSRKKSFLWEERRFISRAKLDLKENSMQNFLISSRKFREYMEDGRVHWRNLVQVIFDHLDDQCQCSIEILIKHGSTYERIRKIMKMIQHAHRWLMADEEEKLQIENRIAQSTRKGESRRYSQHMLRGIECLKQDNIRSFDDVAEALAKYQSREKPENWFSPETHGKRSALLRNRVLSVQELEDENAKLRASVNEYLDENEILKEVIDRNGLQLNRLSRDLEAAKQALALEKQANARLRKALNDSLEDRAA
jgi:hypothetical protein